VLLARFELVADPSALKVVDLCDFFLSHEQFAFGAWIVHLEAEYLLG